MSHPGDKLVEYLRSILVGPRDGKNELIEGDPPAYHYSLGVLFPINSTTNHAVETEYPDISGADSGSLTDALGDDPVALANQRNPSSAGVSFFITGSGRFNCVIEASNYELQETEARKPDKWRRIPLGKPSNLSKFVFDPKSEIRSVLDGKGRLHVHSRKLDDGFLITVALVNSASSSDSLEESQDPYPENCLYQVSISVEPELGARFARYPKRFNSMAGPEESELELLFINRPTYAIGHGCAAIWNVDEEQPSWIKTDFMPKVEVPGPPRHADNFPIQILATLATGSKEDLEQGFEEFANAYSNWIDCLRAAKVAEGTGLDSAADALLDKLSISLARIREGAQLVVENEDVRKAFKVANKAMIRQMEHGKPYLAGTRKTRSESVDFPSSSKYKESTANWHPFQLAFLLLVIPSIADSQHPDRELVDLVWFPTGGGKTEAYFAAAAFEIAIRRIQVPEKSSGTSVISRYTLRLLAAQQFQRAAGLICALEFMRLEEDEAALQGEPITLGLWVGKTETPNSKKVAITQAREVISGTRAGNPFNLERCPWCGTEIIPSGSNQPESEYGFIVDEDEFRLRCPRIDCPFHESLPLQVVDEYLYLTPPTYLMGTVDKFVQLTWSREPGKFFGSDISDPPRLIIQDELHLLSGPLGTTYGVYEAAIDVLIRMRGGNPKYISSTATIRDARSQAQGLYGREVSVFPARGLDEADSYFAKTDPKTPGRIYVGVMSPHHTATTSLIRTTGTLAQAVNEINLLGDASDAYWTQVVFHNSLRELGNYLTQARDDVDSYIKTIASDENTRRTIGYDDVMEVSSKMGPGSPGAITKMERHKGENEAVSIVACSNMFSVGVDVQRLGLMVVNGQPRSTSEYIQATSRVGRGSTPGVVIAHLSSTKPRDRSHYESFFAYHRSLYRHVEPTSVTPMALPSRERNLHASLVIAIRHGAGFSEDEQAAEVDFDSTVVSRVVEQLIKRCSVSDSTTEKDIRRHIEHISDQWMTKRKAGESSRHFLNYQADSKEMTVLLKNFGEKGPGIPTQHSMRNVDALVRLELDT